MDKIILLDKPSHKKIHIATRTHSSTGYVYICNNDLPPHTYDPIDRHAWLFTGLLNSKFRGLLLVLGQYGPSKNFNSVTFCHLTPRYYTTLKYKIFCFLNICLSILYINCRLPSGHLFSRFSKLPIRITWD